MPYPKGKEAFAYIDKRSIAQLEQLLAGLTPEKQEELLSAMKAIEAILAPDSGRIAIRSFQKKDLGHIIDRHEALYAEEYGLNAEFKDYVADAMHKFSESFDPRAENLWIADYDGTAVGCIAIVRVDEQTAQLRWFLVEPEMRGKGVGNLLMQTAVDFCSEKGYRRVVLWTLSILEAARHLYGRFGFRLKERHSHHIWGRELTEECWELERH